MARPTTRGPEPVDFTIITGLSGRRPVRGRARRWRTSGTSSSTTCRRPCSAKMAELRCGGRAPSRVAIVVDVRGGVFFGELSKALGGAARLKHRYRIVFLEASDEDLVHRYEATRRRHPLAPADRVVEGIRKERQMMQTLRGDADLMIDTSGLTPHELRERVRDAFADTPAGTKAPGVGGLLRLQVRGAAGRGPAVRRPVPAEPALGPGPPAAPGDRSRGARVRAGQRSLREFMRSSKALLDASSPATWPRGSRYLTIGVGCTGGHHRSVVVAEELAGIRSMGTPSIAASTGPP